MIQEVKKHLQDNFQFLENKNLLIACSGGVDSIVLAYLMKKLGYQISLAHCNFSLRAKESDGDASFVIGFAKKLEIPVYVETFDTVTYSKTNKISIQLAARELRYQWFDHLLSTFNHDYILTAHHLDDDVETFLINFLRGTGLKGLIGIPDQNQKIVRPLLNFSKEEILQFAKKENLSWREDSSNLETEYLRNKLRLDIIPNFKDLNPSFLKNFRTTRKNLIASKKIIDDYLILVYKLIVTEKGEDFHIDIPTLQTLPNNEELLYQLLSDFGFTEWNDIKNLPTASTGKRVFSATHQLLKNRDELILSELSENSRIILEVPETGINTPIKLEITEVDFITETGNHIIYVDADKIEFPLRLKHWEEGEEFYPFGMRGKKKLSKYFKDEKLSLLEKERTFILYNKNEVVWIIGMRMDNRYKVMDKTKRILKIKYSELVESHIK